MLQPSHRVSAWECEVSISGPATVKPDRPSTYTASGTPAGGSYSWSRTPNLVTSGSTATLTAFKPYGTEYIRVAVYYTNPKGKMCNDVKWVWACLCTLETISGPNEAEVGQEVELSTNADSTGGTYTWTIENGTGALTPNDATAKFIGDQAGPVEIKVSYVPKDGGEPCTKYHTIEITNECEVTLQGGILQRPICRPDVFTTDISPPDGTCDWSPSGSVSATGCSATYNTHSPSLETLTVTYTTPGGGTCKDSKPITSYTLVDNMEPKKVCYSKGVQLKHDDFILNTTPSGFDNNAILNPTIASGTSNEQISKMQVNASLVCDDNSEEVSTVITVVNKEHKDTFQLNFEIPNYIKKPLEIIGIDKNLTLKTTNAYSTNKECCTDSIETSKSGSTSLTLVLPLVGIKWFGIPLPKKIEKYVRADVRVNLNGNANATLKATLDGCNPETIWSGEGFVDLGLALNGGIKANATGAIVVEGLAEGATGIKQSLNVVNPDELQIATSWGGFTAKAIGKLAVPRLGLATEFDISRTVLRPGSLPTAKISLPSLGE